MTVRTTLNPLCSRPGRKQLLLGFVVWHFLLQVGFSQMTDPTSQPDFPGRRKGSSPLLSSVQELSLYYRSSYYKISIFLTRKILRVKLASSVRKWQPVLTKGQSLVRKRTVSEIAIPRATFSELRI